MPSQLDQLGILKIFPDRIPGQALYMNKGDGFFEKYSKHGYESIKNVEIWRKTFGFNQKERLRADVEATIYIFLPKLNKEYGSHKKIGKCSSGSGLSVKLRGGNHSDKSDKSAKCYVIHYEYEGGECNNFQKEYPHPKYAKYTIEETNTSPMWVGRIMGFKCICLNNHDNKEVEIFSYFDASAKLVEPEAREPFFTTMNDWKLRYHVTDKGQFKKTKKTTKPFVSNWGKYIEFRMDNAPEDTQCLYASVREISKESFV